MKYSRDISILTSQSLSKTPTSLRKKLDLRRRDPRARVAVAARARGRYQTRQRRSAGRRRPVQATCAAATAGGPAAPGSQTAAAGTAGPTRAASCSLAPALGVFFSASYLFIYILMVRVSILIETLMKIGF